MVKGIIGLFQNDIIMDVDTGDIQVAESPVCLQSIALGSCIALIMYESELKIGGLAHIMLPGRSTSNQKPTQYAEDAIESLIDTVKILGAKAEDLQISIVGGANILQEGDLPDKLIESVLGHLERLNFGVTFMRVGGILRRSVMLDTNSGQIFFTEGDDTTKVLLSDITKL